MADLPYQGKLLAPIEWTGNTHKNTMQAAGYKQSVTIGLRPYMETTTLQWVLKQAEATDLLEDFKAGNLNGIYDYTCKIRGAVRVKLTGEYGFQECPGSQRVIVSATVETV